MFQWIKNFKESSSLTKNAVIAVVIWAVPVVLITFYCYARLDFVRTDTNSKSTEKSTSK